MKNLIQNRQAKMLFARESNDEPTFHASFPMSRRAKSEESTCFQWNVSIAVYMKLFSLSVKNAKEDNE